DGYVVETLGAKQHSLSRVEIVAEDEQLPGHAMEGVGDVATVEKIRKEALIAVQREHPGGQRVVQAIELFPQRGAARLRATEQQTARALSQRAEGGGEGALPLGEIRAPD